MDEAIKFIQAVGFPIAVAAYVLWRMEYTQKELIKAMNRLTYVLGTKGILINGNGEEERKKHD